MNNVNDIVKKAERTKTLARNLFNTIEGKEFLVALDRMFIDVPLYKDTERETIYSIAQHDLIIEIKSWANANLIGESIEDE